MFADQGAVAVGAPSMVLPETPYSGLQVTSLVACTVLLILCGWMGYDLLRNMWSWNGAYTVNSSLMDFLVGLFG
jgi:TRAP-type C4-dicarboxylate transport system permease small subunit